VSAAARGPASRGRWAHHRRCDRHVRLQERITTTTKGFCQPPWPAIYVPAYDLPTALAPATLVCASLDAPHGAFRRDSLRLRASIRGGPARFHLAHALAADLRQEHYSAVAAPHAADSPALQALLEHIAILGMDELSEEDYLTVLARPQDRALSCRRPFTSPRCFTARPSTGRTCRKPSRFTGLCEGNTITMAQCAFYMVGSIEEGVEKGKRWRRSGIANNYGVIADLIRQSISRKMDPGSSPG